MSKLNLSVAIGDYDRDRPLIDGAVQIDGVDPVFMNSQPEEIFFRAFRAEDFDICECSLSSFTVKTAERQLSLCRRAGLRVADVPSHLDVRAARDRIKPPEDFKGKEVGLPEYQLTANVWARAILEDDFGVKPSDMHWMRGGIEHAGRPEKITIKLPDGVRLDRRAGGQDDLAIVGATARSTASWRRGRRRCEKTNRTSAGCSAIRSRRPRTITSAPESSRSCI